MFEVKDRDNKTLFIKDKIVHSYNNGPEERVVEGIVIAFPEEGMVQYEPVKEGLPVICGSNEVMQIDSLAQRAMSLKTEADFQQLILDAYERYKSAVKTTTQKKAGTRGGKTKAPKQMTEAELTGMGISLEGL